MRNNSIFCWHHGDLSRLEKLLARGLIDCPSASFLIKHGLHRGDLLRVSVKVKNQSKGQLEVLGRLSSSEPFLLDPPFDPKFPYAVLFEAIPTLENLGECYEYPKNPRAMSRSHWVDAI